MQVFCTPRDKQWGSRRPPIRPEAATHDRMQGALTLPAIVSKA